MRRRAAARSFETPGSVKGRASTSAISSAMRTARLCPSVPYTIAMSAGAFAKVSRRSCASLSVSSLPLDADAVEGPEALAPASAVGIVEEPLPAWRNCTSVWRRETGQGRLRVVRTERHTTERTPMKVHR